MNNENKIHDNPSDDISAILEELPYPKEFLEKYDIINLLAEKNGTETFLAKGKSDGKEYVVKCYDSSMRHFTHENELLSGLSHKGLPVYVDSFSNDRVLISVREYIEGQPLDLFVAGRSINENRAVNIISQLCDILTYLHNRPEPIIHRDIKPNNIIMKPDGTIVLIDFDIARKYHEDAERDTGLLATPGYAPPEQYGFSQTDPRADIFAMGVLFRWLLTGDKKESENDGISPVLRNIIDKCTEFSPVNRFKSAAQVKSALARIKSSTVKKSVAPYIIVPLLCLLTFGAGFLLGRNMPRQVSDGAASVGSPTEAATTEPDQEDMPGQEDMIVFKEPLIEKSVRMQVGKTDGEPLTAEDLRSVTGVFVIGENVFGNFTDADAAPIDVPFGPITTLEDLRMLPSLTNIMIKYQNIHDISPVAGIMPLRMVSLAFMPVSDASALEGLPYLETLTLSGTAITDLSVLDSLPRLSGVYLTDTVIPLEKIGGRETVKTLGLSCNRYDSFDGLIGFDKLERLELGYSSVSDGCSFEPLHRLPSLKLITATGDLAEALKKEFRGTNVELRVG